MKRKIILVAMSGALALSGQAAATCEFSIGAAANGTVDGSADSFRERTGWQDGSAGYAAGCALANLLFDVRICGEFYRDQSGEPCVSAAELEEDDPVEEVEMIEDAVDYSWSYQHGANPYDPSTWNYDAPVAPPWVLMTDFHWDEFRQGRGDCRFSVSCGVATVEDGPDFP